MFKNLRMAMIGFIFGVMFASGLVYAENIQASIMDCKIQFNNVPYESKDPVLNYNGKAYVPLREFGTMINGSVGWVADIRTIYISQDPKIKEITLTKEIPKEVIKEVVKEVPVEVVKEVDKSNAEYTTIKYDNGDSFIGFVNKINGNRFGTYTYKDGTSYHGEMEGNEFCGIGKIMYSDKSIYVGHFYKNHQSSLGIQVDTHGILAKLYEDQEESGTSYFISKDQSQIVGSLIKTNSVINKLYFYPEKQQTSTFTPQTNNYSYNNSSSSQKNIDLYNIDAARIKAKYQELRNQASSNSALNKKRLAEDLANRGLSASGAMRQLELSTNVALQNELNRISQQEEWDLKELKIKYGVN